MSSIIPTPREITDDEVRSFQENDWAKIESFLSEDEAAALLTRLEAKLEQSAEKGGHAVYGPMLEALGPLSVEGVSGEVADRFFFDMTHQRAWGQAAARLLGVESVRYQIDQGLIKRPARDGGDGTVWHVDFGGQEPGSLFASHGSAFAPARSVIAFWIALKPTPATSGTMRFVAPRHFDQPLHDLVHATYAEQKSIEESYEELEQRGILSPPLDLKPGDATVHRGALHSAPPNKGDGIRWAFAVSYVQADVHYTGLIDELVMAGVDGLEKGKTLPDHRFHIIG